MSCRNSTMPPAARRMSEILVARHMKEEPDLQNPPEERVIDAFVERLQALRGAGFARHRHHLHVEGSEARRAPSRMPWRMSISRRRAAPSSIRTRRRPAGWSRRSRGLREEGQRRRAEGCRIPHAKHWSACRRTAGSHFSGREQLNDISAELTRARGGQGECRGSAPRRCATPSPPVRPRIRCRT